MTNLSQEREALNERYPEAYRLMLGFYTNPAFYNSDPNCRPADNVLMAIEYARSRPSEPVDASPAIPDVGALLLQFALRCSSSNPASLGSAVNDAITVLERIGVEPRSRGTFYHTDVADLNNARQLLATIATPKPTDGASERALREALEPFGSAAKWWAAFSDQQRITSLHAYGDCLEVRHLRAADAALSTPTSRADDDVERAVAAERERCAGICEHDASLHADGKSKFGAMVSANVAAIATGEYLAMVIRTPPSGEGGAANG